jgi:hypothetical protein
MSNPTQIDGIEELADVISGETTFSPREAEVLLRVERNREVGHNPRTRSSVHKAVAEEMGIEQTTVQTLQDRASKKGERAWSTAKFQDDPETYLMDKPHLPTNVLTKG